MNIYVISAIAAGLVCTGVVLAGSVGLDTPTAAPSDFADACRESLSGAADWAIGESEQRGKDVSFVKRAQIGVKIPTVCSCTQDALQGEIEGDQWLLAGKLTGIQIKLAIAMRAKDRSVARSARETLKGELQEVMSAHAVSIAEVGKLTRAVDSAMKRCFKANMR